MYSFRGGLYNTAIMASTEQYRIDRQNILTPSQIAYFEGSYFYNDPDKTISIVHNCFDRIIEPAAGILEYMNNFGRYIPTDPGEFHATIEDFLRNAYQITHKSFDASRTITGIELSVPSFISRIPTPSLLWRADLRIMNGVNLGDGQAVYTEASKRWQFTQQVGRYQYTSLLKTQQHKRW